MFSRYPNRINQVTPKKGTPFNTTKSRRKKGRIDNIRTKAGRASLLHFCFWRGKFTVGSWCSSSEDKKQNTINCKYIIQSLTASQHSKILSAVSGIFHKQTYTCGVCNRFKKGVCLKSFKLFYKPCLIEKQIRHMPHLQKPYASYTLTYMDKYGSVNNRSGTSSVN